MISQEVGVYFLRAHTVNVSADRKDIGGSRESREQPLEILLVSPLAKLAYWQSKCYNISRSVWLPGGARRCEQGV